MEYVTKMLEKDNFLFLIKFIKKLVDICFKNLAVKRDSYSLYIPKLKSSNQTHILQNHKQLCWVL